MIEFLSLQIHERLKRFEKGSIVPVQEHAASLASDVSYPLLNILCRQTHRCRTQQSEKLKICHGLNTFL